MGITVNVIKKIATVGKRKNGNIELRIVSWNNMPGKYDIRLWYSYNGEERCGKGITLTEDQLRQVFALVTNGKMDEGLVGTIPVDGRTEIRIQISMYGYEIGFYSGNYSMKRLNLNKAEYERLGLILNRIFVGAVSAPTPETPAEPKAKAKTGTRVEKKVEKKTEKPAEPQKTVDSVVNGLTSLPVNDGNYPLGNATIDQIREAIKIMEAKPEGNKTRLTRCKAKLKSLEAGSSRKTSKVSKITKTAKADVKAKTTAKTEKPADIIQFPKKDSTVIKKAAPTGEGHTYEECVAKLSPEKERFNGDRDTGYVIDALLEHCVVDQEFRDNVMRPEKSWIGVLQYLFNKAKAGYCIKIGGTVGIMSAETALKYAIDYFNSAE